MVRKLSLICAVAGALVFPVTTFAGEGDDHRHQNEQGQHHQNEQDQRNSEHHDHDQDQINATLRIIGTITITIIGTLGTGTMGAIGTTA